MSVIDIRTRQTVDAGPVTESDDHDHSRQMRVLKNFLIDSEAFGIRWTDIRSWLVNALAYVDAKIELQKFRGK